MKEKSRKPIDASTEDHPRPQFQRSVWYCLNGTWEFHIDTEGTKAEPIEVGWDREILVPFSPETSASGVGHPGFYSVVWYQQTFLAPELKAGQRLILHFEAVDYHASVWVNGVKVCVHQGGYTPFSADITAALHEPNESQEVVVRAEDDPAGSFKARGKQDWRLEPHSIWYPRTTGIWQTVWMERVPAIRLDSLTWTSDLARWEIGLDVAVDCPTGRKLTLAVRLMREHIVLATDTYEVLSGEVHRRIALSDPGIDDYRNDLLWSPTSPTLIDAFLELRDENGQIIDTVQSYTALRSVDVQGDKFVLNGRPLILRLILDQGYWPNSGSTAPNDQALVHDVLLPKCWASTVYANIRRSSVSVISTGLTAWVYWYGKRCPVRTATPLNRSTAHSGMD